jgi:hypothetical protein
MFSKNNLISLSLSGIDFSSTSFTEAQQIEKYSCQPFIAVGNSLPIEVRLAETIEWCLALADPLSPKDSLRSEDLKPAFANSDNEFFYDPQIRVYNTWLLLDARSRLLEQDIAPVCSYEDLKGGKLLAYFQDETVWDGASEAASMEFFDVLDVPAWDTWIGLFSEPRGDFIVSYIPENFIDFAQAGIDVNCISCIEWLEDTRTNLAKELLNKGIIR